MATSEMVLGNLIAAGFAAVSLLRARWWMGGINGKYGTAFRWYEGVHLACMILFAYFFFPALNFTFETAVPSWIYWIEMIFVTLTLIFITFSNDFWHLSTYEMTGKLRTSMFFTIAAIITALTFMICALAGYWSSFTQVWVQWSFLILSGLFILLGIAELVFCLYGTMKR